MAWTQNKRRSVQSYTMGLMRPVADASIGVSDRAAVAWLFAATSYPTPTVITGGDRIVSVLGRAMGNKAFGLSRRESFGRPAWPLQTIHC